MNWSARAHRGRTFGLLVGALGAPVMGVAIYLTGASWFVPARWWERGLVMALLLGVVIGLACVARLPECLAVRVVLAGLYVPATGGGLVVLWALAEKLWPGS
ncbi:MAG TPA: hypothetical protein VGE74_21495 [Gemmata sp.]